MCAFNFVSITINNIIWILYGVASTYILIFKLSVQCFVTGSHDSFKGHPKLSNLVIFFANRDVWTFQLCGRHNKNKTVIFHHLFLQDRSYWGYVWMILMTCSFMRNEQSCIFMHQSACFCAVSSPGLICTPSWPTSRLSSGYVAQPSLHADHQNACFFKFNRCLGVASNPWFVVRKAAYCFQGHDHISAEIEVVCDTDCSLINATVTAFSPWSH